MKQRYPGQVRCLEGGTEPYFRVALLDLPHRHDPDSDAFCEIFQGPASFPPSLSKKVLARSSNPSPRLKAWCG
jgi:hypothetical protein